MAAVYRLSSFFFGASAPPQPLPPAAAAEGLTELQQRLLGEAEVDVEAAFDDKWRFSWRRLLLHVGWVWCSESGGAPCPDPALQPC